MLSKIVSAISRRCKHRKYEHFLSREKNAQNVFRHPRRILAKLFLRLGTALLTGPMENCPITSPVQLLIQKLFWASEDFYQLCVVGVS